jgi:hypothetical protein
VFGGVFMSQRRRTCGGCDAGGWRPTPRPKRRGRAALPGGSGPLYTTLSLDNQKTTDKSFPFKRSLAFVRRRRLGNKRMYNVAVVRYQYNHFCRTRALIREKCTQVSTVSRVRQVVVRHMWALPRFFFGVRCPNGSSEHSQRSCPGKEGRI